MNNGVSTNTSGQFYLRNIITENLVAPLFQADISGGATVSGVSLRDISMNDAAAAMQASVLGTVASGTIGGSGGGRIAGLVEGACETASPVETFRAVAAVIRSAAGLAPDVGALSDGADRPRLTEAARGLENASPTQGGIILGPRVHDTIDRAWTDLHLAAGDIARARLCAEGMRVGFCAIIAAEPA